jgi:hypothetical protein
VEENAYLVLGCYGRTENGFILCPSTENRILKLDDALVDVDGITNYLDVVKLFDRPLLDQNSIRHLVYNLQDRFNQKFKKLWTDHEYHLLERFMHMHKDCGLYSQIILVPSDFETKKPMEDQVSFVLGIPELKNNKTPSLKAVRGRKYG